MLIGICGGIGSGKSIVSRILRELGEEVIDCDREAKILMAESQEIKSAIRDRISSEVTDGIAVPDRKRLAEIVFTDEEARRTLNSIVHGSLKKAVRKRAERSKIETSCFEKKEEKLIFVEAAILAESGLAELCDRIWKVEAEESVRMDRVIRRDGMERREVESRMRSQGYEATLMQGYLYKTTFIYNTEYKSLIRQIEFLLDKIKK